MDASILNYKVNDNVGKFLNQEKKLRNAVAGRSALLQLVGGSALSKLLGAAEAGRFMNPLR